jgi:exonuclease SbcD
MRLLHTADWHVGKTIRGRSRMDEFERVLDEVVEVALDQGVDAVLVAGDLYESRVAPPEADHLVFETFLRLYREGIPVVAIPGNHDSSPRFDALAGLLRVAGVHVVPRVARPDRGSVVEARSRDGKEAAVVACVPFVPERRFGDAAALFEATESWYQDYAQGMGDLLQAMAGAFRPNRVNVLMAHLFTDGALLGGGEREVTTGLEYAVSPARLPANATYIALGHIHRPQVVRGSPAPARYPGSLLQLDFGERDQKKSVVVVDARPGKPAKVTEIPLRTGRKLVDVHAALAELPALADGLGDAYVRVYLAVPGPQPGVAEQVRDIIPNAVDVHLVYERAEDEPDGPPVSSLQPEQQFARYHADRYGAEPDPGLVAAFHEVLAMTGEGG